MLTELAVTCAVPWPLYSPTTFTAYPPEGFFLASTAVPTSSTGSRNAAAAIDFGRNWRIRLNLGRGDVVSPGLASPLIPLRAEAPHASRSGATLPVPHESSMRSGECRACACIKQTCL